MEVSIGGGIEPKFIIKKDGEKPNTSSVRLSEISKRLPDYYAYDYQIRVVEEFSKGNDVLVTAGIASGKTEAILAAIDYTESYPVIMIYPTRALARDQYERMKEYGFNVTIADSDHSYWRQKIAKDDYEIILTNPEMVWRHYKFGYSLKNAIEDAHAIVFDEVHFYSPPEMSKVIGMIKTFKDKRFLFSSATIGNYKEFCNDIEEITGRKCSHVEGRSLSSVKYYLSYPAMHHIVIQKSVEWVISNNRKMLAFFPSRSMAEKWFLKIRPKYGDKVMLHHGALPRNDRRIAEEEFKDGECAVLFTVKTLQQGIDIGDCDTALHVGLPSRISDFRQRDGRIGRRENITAVSILTSTEHDVWSTNILTSKDKFESMYISSKPEKLVYCKKCELSKKIKFNPNEGFYENDTVKALDEKGNEIMRLSIHEIPYRLVPGCLMLVGNTVRIVSKLDKNRMEAITVRNRAIEEEVLNNGLWYRPVVKITTELSDYTIRRSRLKVITKEVIYEKDDVVVNSIPVMEEIELEAYVTSVQIKNSSEEIEAGIHLIQHELAKIGIPYDSFSHVSEEGRLIIYESPPAVLPNIIEEIKEIKVGNADLLIHPRCPISPKVDGNKAKKVANKIIKKISRIKTNNRSEVNKCPKCYNKLREIKIFGKKILVCSNCGYGSDRVKSIINKKIRGI